MNMVDSVKYPDIYVKLSDIKQSFHMDEEILDRVANAMKRHKVPQEEIDEFLFQATKSDFFTLINKVIRWVDTDVKDNPRKYFFYV